MPSWAAAIPLVGSLISGAGEAKANAQNKGTKTRLGWGVENLRQLADPVGRSLGEGYQPGGWLRRSATASALMPAEQRRGQAREQLRSNAWRYGGPGSGVGLRRWQDADLDAALAGPEAEMTGDVEGLDTLARMEALQRGYSRAFSPETVYSNPYAWVGDLTSGFAQGYRPSGGGTV